MANTGQYDSQTNIELEDYEREIFVQPEAAVIYGGSVVNSVNGQTGDVTLTTSDLENTSDYQTATEVQSAIDTAVSGKQDILTAGTNIQINNDVISATGTTYSAGSGLNLSGTTFSVDTNTIATVQDVTNEATTRENADIGLQGQIDAITSSSDVKDIVGTYTELQNYDTSTLGNDDIIKVLQDSTHNNAMTYYRWIISGGAGSWQYIGEEGPYYTKSETETLLNNKQDEITSSNKLLSDLVDDTNQTNKFVTENEKTTWNTEIENLQEEDELLKRNLQTTTGSGEEVTLEKTAELDFVKPPLPMGNSEQESTTGKNLLRPDGTPTTIRGVSWSYREDGAVVGERVSSNENVSDFTLTANNTFNPGSYIFSCFDSESTPGASTYQANISINGVSNWRTGNYSFVLNEVSTIRVVLRVYPNFTGTAIFKPMIRLSSIQESNYEPYTGGIPSPSPSYPQEVEVVTGNVGVTISNENNTESKTLPVSLGNIELCKLGDYQDYFYKDSGKWYLHKETGKVVLDGSESWVTGSVGTNSYLLRIIGIKYPPNANDTGLFIKSSHFRGIPITSRLTSGDNLIYVEPSPFINIRNTPFTSISDFKTWLSTHNTIAYYILETPTDTEITDTTLISQLEEISKTLSYQGQTNITSNTIALFDVEAYQSTKLILEDLDLTKLSTFDNTKTQILKNINGSLIWVDE